MKRSIGVLLVFCLVLAASPALAADPCASVSSSVTLSELSTVEEDSIQAKGTWQAAGGAAGATGILLETRIDSDRMQSEAQAGTSGSWSITQEVTQGCGRHTVRFFAFPYVQDGTRQIHCLKQASSASKQFEISCAPVVEIVDCQWECSGEECTGTCAASARRGKLMYVPHWGVNGESWLAGEPSEGPWSQPVACEAGQRISFKVRDRDGRGQWSQMDEIGCGATE